MSVANSPHKTDMEEGPRLHFDWHAKFNNMQLIQITTRTIGCILLLPHLIACYIMCLLIPLCKTVANYFKENI